jgi:hypothetical protein
VYTEKLANETAKKKQPTLPYVKIKNTMWLSNLEKIQQES